MLVYASVRTCFFSIRQCQQAGISSIPCIMHVISYLLLNFAYSDKYKIWLIVMVHGSSPCIMIGTVSNYLLILLESIAIDN